MPYRAKHRALIAQTMIDLVKTVRSGRMSKVRSIESVIISAAVVVGHAAGRPRTASDIARALDIPRVTVIRKLAELVRDGLIDRQGSRYFMVENPPAGESYVDDALRVISRANHRIGCV
jgi:predicted transcriptional regulator